MSRFGKVRALSLRFGLIVLFSAGVALSVTANDAVESTETPSKKIAKKLAELRAPVSGLVAILDQLGGLQVTYAQEQELKRGGEVIELRLRPTTLPNVRSFLQRLEQNAPHLRLHELHVADPKDGRGREIYESAMTFVTTTEKSGGTATPPASHLLAELKSLRLASPGVRLRSVAVENARGTTQVRWVVDGFRQCVEVSAALQRKFPTHRVTKTYQHGKNEDRLVVEISAPRPKSKKAKL